MRLIMKRFKNSVFYKQNVFLNVRLLIVGFWAASSLDLSLYDFVNATLGARFMDMRLRVYVLLITHVI